MKETRSYACIALPNRAPFDIFSDSDLGWPFDADGQIDDATLISVITFIRSQPRIPGVQVGVWPRIVDLAPVSGIVRRGEEIVVGLRIAELQGAQVTIARKGAQWVITNYERWIV